MQAFEVKYETPSHIPPPYCYYYHIKGKVDDKGLYVDFQWVYHQREGLSEEEIQDEGFTTTDDVAWSGHLHPTWRHEFEKLLAHTRAAKSEREDQAYLHITVTVPGKVLFEGEPKNLADWEYFLQEFIQAIYETAGKEAPLIIQLKDIDNSKSSQLYTLKMQFKDRQIIVTATKKDGITNNTTLAWDQGQKVLPAIYNLQFQPEEATPQEPRSAGTYIDIGEGLWYELGKNALNPSPQKDYIAIIKRFFSDLL